jgi:hypothetical protein
MLVAPLQKRRHDGDNNDMAMDGQTRDENLGEKMRTDDRCACVERSIDSTLFYSTIHCTVGTKIPLKSEDVTSCIVCFAYDGQTNVTVRNGSRTAVGIQTHDTTKEQHKQTPKTTNTTNADLEAIQRSTQHRIHSSQYT